MKLKLLNKASILAKQLHNSDQNICAIIVDKRNRILSVGYNSYKKTSPLQKHYASKVGEINKIFNHAEIDCIKKLPYNSKPYAIYISRISHGGNLLNSKPCPICQLAIKSVGIKKIYHS